MATRIKIRSNLPDPREEWKWVPSKTHPDVLFCKGWTIKPDPSKKDFYSLIDSSGKKTGGSINKKVLFTLAKVYQSLNEKRMNW